MYRKLQMILIGLVIILIILVVLMLSHLFPEKEKEEKVKYSANPNMYEVCDEDSCIFLLGTIHVGDKRLEGLNSKIWDAYQESDFLALEVDVLNMVSASSLSNYYLEEGDVLANHMSPELYHQLEAFCENHGISIEMLASMNLASAYNVLSSWVYHELGLTAIYGVDIQLALQAKSDKKPLIELESYAFQENLLYGFSDEFYSYALAEFLNNYETFKWETKMLYHAYVDGTTWLLKGLLSVPDSSNPLENEYNQKMIFDRNIEMSKKAETFLKNNKKVLIAVGDAHVEGTKGIIDILREKGYEIQIIQ